MKTWCRIILTKQNVDVDCIVKIKKKWLIYS